MTTLFATSDIPAPLVAAPLRAWPRLRRHATTLLSALVIGHCSLITPVEVRAADFDLASATIADLNAAFASGALTSEKLVQLYLARIDAYDQKGPALNTVITLKARETVLAEARALDAERKAGKVRSPLHGIVVLPKDVFDTMDLPTSGGFKPMATSQPSRDSFVIARLRAAGAIILGKLNQSDWYGVAPSAGSSLKGQVLSPYNLKKFPGGSSSGTGAAMAAWFGTVGLGSDTTGSIVIPTALNNLVGFSTTHGLVSRTGMMWSSPSQENGGPMARSVYDCAAVLDIIAGYDPADLPTQASIGKLPTQSYTTFINKDGLKGARVGVLREMLRSGPGHEEGLALGEKAIADFKKAGAVVVDPVLTGLILHQSQNDASGYPYEVAFAIDKYLAGLPPTAPIRSVKEMIAKAPDLVKPAIVKGSQIPTLDRHPELAAALKHQEVLRNALIAVMDKYELDALILPFRTYRIEDLSEMANTNRNESRNQLASVTGLPAVIVPGGFFADGMPFAMEFLGRPFSEPKLITLASGYEAATQHRKAPATTPALPGEKITY
jgi:amidase